MASRDHSTDRAFELARGLYAELGVDVDAALDRLAGVAVSVHCWQGDDVGGFEGGGRPLGGGLAVTGSYPGKARNADELRSDLETAFALIPGRHRLNLHAIYAETGGQAVDRDGLGPEHFRGWVDWARENGLGIDFNPTFFSHPMAADGFTLSHRDAGVRRFWVDHGIACRRIGRAIGEALGQVCVTNVWIPDGSKETPVDRGEHRGLLLRSLDEMFAEPIDAAHHRDAVESKLFGLGSESYVVGSHEFYLGYALSRGKLPCLDAGHFHPTEVISDKISALFCFFDEIMLHVSRGVRWDSDHVVTLTDEVQAIAREAVSGDRLGRIFFGLDYFDASINRVAAWVVGTRALLRALLIALLEPVEVLRDRERAGDLTARLALVEEFRSLPWGAVWDHYCAMKGVPVGPDWLESVRAYERDVLSKRA